MRKENNYTFEVNGYGILKELKLTVKKNTPNINK